MIKPYCINCQYPGELIQDGLCVFARCDNPKSPFHNLDIYPLDSCPAFELASDLKIMLVSYLINKFGGKNGSS